ncbi:coil containing protein [Vibrio phage 1.273.O._10N.286.54.C7]|nr:coil containing protein [Vibrio phage 1.273.O._10N.286.54.C7]
MSKESYYATNLVDSVSGGYQFKMTVEMINSISEMIGIEPIAVGSSESNSGFSTPVDKYMIYMIMKLGERVVELENKQRESEL